MTPGAMVPFASPNAAEVPAAYTPLQRIFDDPLWNPDRHTFVKALRWDAQGMPVFGRASTA